MQREKLFNKISENITASIQALLEYGEIERENLDQKYRPMYQAQIDKGTKAEEAYGSNVIFERHRHRYEVNNEYRKQIADKGLVFSGLSPDGMLCEMVELPQNDWFVACQFHPEFKSRPEHPHPLFAGLINAINKRKDK